MITERLAASELRYRRLFETAQEGILLIDFKTGMILDVNPFLIKMLNYSKEKFLNKHLWEVGVFKDITASKENFKTLQTNKYVRFEDLPLETKSGKKIDVEFIANAYKVGNATIIQCDIRDITDRKEIERKLKETEKKFTEAFKKSPYAVTVSGTEDKEDKNEWLAAFPTLNPMPLVVLDKDKGIIFINLEAERLFPDLKKKQINHPFLSKSMTYFKQLSFPTKNFATREIDINNRTYLQSFSLVNSHQMCIYANDITDRKKVDQVLQTLTSRQESILKAIPDIIMEVNKDKVYMWANQPGKDFFGKDVIGKTADFYFEGQQNTYDIVQPIFTGSENTTYVESWQRRKDGQKRLLAWWCRSLKDENGNVTGAISTARDITDHKNMENQIIEDKLQDEAIFDSIGDAVFASDKDGKILLFNKMAEELTGITATDAIDHHYDQTITFVKESNGKPINDFITNAIQNKKITKMANHVMLLRKDGRKIPVADSAAPIINTKGEIIGCVVVFHDVTKERGIDRAKTEFVSLASHQLRTPLTTLSWFSEILASGDDGKLNGKQQQHAEEIHNASKRMITLVNTLLNVSRLELGTFAIEPQMVNIKEIVKICLEELTSQISNKRIVFQEKYDPNITSISVDPKLLTIILENLLSNAIKYTPTSGQVNLTTSKENGSVVFKISDTGIGIPEAQQDKIFTKLFRADNAVKIDPDGTGLGLYMVKEITDHAGGKVWFESQEGKGTTFYVSFPLSGMIRKEGEKQLA